MLLPKLEAKFHKTVRNPTAPDGEVAMYHLADGETFETYASLAVPHTRHDWAREIAFRCNAHDGLIDLLELAGTSLESGLETEDEEMEPDWSIEDRAIVKRIKDLVRLARDGR